MDLCCLTEKTGIPCRCGGETEAPAAEFASHCCSQLTKLWGSASSCKEVSEPLYPIPPLISNALLRLELPCSRVGSFQEWSWEPFPGGWEPASPPPLIPGGCSATLEKLGLFAQELSHLLATSCPVLLSRWTGPLLQPCPGSGQSPNPRLWGWGWLLWWLCEHHSCLWLGFVSRRFCWTILRNLGLATWSLSAEFLPP